MVSGVRGGLGALLVLRHAGAAGALSHAVPAVAGEPRARRGLPTIPRQFLESLYGPLATPLTLAAAITGSVFRRRLCHANDRRLHRRPMARPHHDRDDRRAVHGGRPLPDGVRGRIRRRDRYACSLASVFSRATSRAKSASSTGPSDLRRSTAFQTFLLGVQIAVIVAPIVTGFLGEKVAWHYGFGAAGVGMAIALVVYRWGRKYLPPERPRGAAAHERAVGKAHGPRLGDDGRADCAAAGSRGNGDRQPGDLQRVPALGRSELQSRLLRRDHAGVVARVARRDHLDGDGGRRDPLLDAVRALLEGAERDRQARDRRVDRRRRADDPRVRERQCGGDRREGVAAVGLGLPRRQRHRLRHGVPGGPGAVLARRRRVRSADCSSASIICTCSSAISPPARLLA